MAHGSAYHRHAGSTVLVQILLKHSKGKHMPGHMEVKITKFRISKYVLIENNLLGLAVWVLGPKKFLVTIKEAVKAN